MNSFNTLVCRLLITYQFLLLLDIQLQYVVFYAFDGTVQLQ